MKSPLTLLLVLLVALIPISRALASCTPKATFLSEEYQGCPILKKSSRWRANWPDATADELIASGFGACSNYNVCCDARERSQECWPLFHAPKAESMQLSIRVQEQEVVISTVTCTGGCSPAKGATCSIKSDSTYAVTHSCSATGRGDEELACIPQCYGEYVCYNGLCGYTPIVIDVSGNGFDLTSGVNGVDFDFNDDGIPGRLSWTAVGSDDAWLVFDRNGNGIIDSGSELFGSTTPQPPPQFGQIRNGFLALGEYDKPAHGGNDDLRINGGDLIFPLLRLWQDQNHNGVSEPNELLTLSGVGIMSLELEYKETRRVDSNGNAFRYSAKVNRSNGAGTGRWAYDVFLVTP